MKKIPLILALLGIAQITNAQPFDPETAPFIKSITTFTETDRATPPAKDPVLFIGSSSLTMWKDIGEYFPRHPIINRAFGGSNLTHQIYFVNEIVLKYQPQKIILYCGENDIASGASAETVADRFKIWFRQVRKNMPAVPIAYISMKPSPSREKYLDTMRQGNQLIREFLTQQTHTQYVDIFPLMLDTDGKPRTDIFLKDMLHMNKGGYKLWQKALAPHLNLQAQPPNP
jgi:lysophospholipase L1-like esterase